MGKKSKKEDALEESQAAIDESQVVDDGPPKLSYEEEVERALPISQPMASKKLASRAFKVVKKGLSEKKIVIGLKNVKKNIKKGNKGFVLLAGDTDPMDVISHLPIYCEEHSIPYIWVPTRARLAKPLQKGSSVAVMVASSSSYKEHYDEVFQKIKDTPLPV